MTQPPAGLSTTDQLLIDYIRSGRPDAEIAVHLGISIGEVKDRIERLQRTLNVNDRAALGAWSPAQRRPADQASPSPEVSQPAVAAENAKSPGRRTLTWMGVAAVAAVAAIVLGAFAFLAGDSDSVEPSGASDETPEPGSSPEPRAASAITIGSVEPLTMRISDTHWGSPFWVLVTTGGCFYCDGPPTALNRVAWWPDGTFSNERLFTVPEGWTMTGIESSVSGYTLGITICWSSSGEPCANALPELPVITQIWRSTDGGAKWELVAEVDRSLSIVAASPGGELLKVRLSEESDELLLPNGTSVEVPQGYRWLGVTASGNSVEESPVTLGPGNPLVDIGPFFVRYTGLVEPAPALPIPEITGAFASGYFEAPDGDGYFLATTAPGGPGSPSSGYVALVDSQTAVQGVWDITGAQLGAVVTSEQGTAQGLGVRLTLQNPLRMLPTVFQFDTRSYFALPGAWEVFFRDDVLTVVAGSLGAFVGVAGLDGPDDCLNLREAPSTEATALVCVPQGTMLRLRPEDTTTPDGWMPITAPDGRPAWAFGEFLLTTALVP